MSAFIDLIGQRFSRLIVLRLNSIKNGVTHWQVICDCGVERSVQAGALRGGYTKSCGCYSKDRTRERSTTHGLSGSSTYTSWKNMWGRCRNKNNADFKNYGARGITVCSEWKEFSAFLRDMGVQPPGLTLERVNNNAGYFLSNCRWATMREQNNNRRNNHLLSLDGETLTIRAWSRKLGGSDELVNKRLKAGWPIHRALKEPCRERTLAN